MKIVCLLALFWIQAFQGATVPPCCITKTVGEVEYDLVVGVEVGPGYKTVCLSDCVYKKKNDDDSGEKYCFGAGNLTVECGDKTEPETDGADNLEARTDSCTSPTPNGGCTYCNGLTDANDKNCCPGASCCSTSTITEGQNQNQTDVLLCGGCSVKRQNCDYCNGFARLDGTDCCPGSNDCSCCAGD